MKKSHKSLIALFFAIVLIFNVSIIAFADEYKKGESTSSSIGNRIYTAYNSISYNSRLGATASTYISCDTECSAGELGVYPMISDHNYNVISSPGWLFNTESDTEFSGKTSSYTEKDTYYSAGDGQGYNDIEGTFRIIVTPVSPGIGVSSISGEISSSTSGKLGNYDVNINGQTFGNINSYIAKGDYPDLVGAVGVDGTVGYVLSKELFYKKFPSSREEAVALMTDPYYIQGRMINLYAVDGVTVIGKFLAGSLIGVTIKEDDMTITYHDDGTIVRTYANGVEKVDRWK